jgi:hypothetical protein
MSSDRAPGRQRHLLTLLRRETVAHKHVEMLLSERYYHHVSCMYTVSWDVQKSATEGKC